MIVSYDVQVVDLLCHRNDLELNYGRRGGQGDAWQHVREQVEGECFFCVRLLLGTWINCRQPVIVVKIQRASEGFKHSVLEL